jgi:NADH:ubiquinone oxidoreductase subunit
LHVLSVERCDAKFSGVPPGRDGWLDKVEEENEKLRPDSWKGYTIGDNTNKKLAKRPFRLLRREQRLRGPRHGQLA